MADTWICEVKVGTVYIVMIHCCVYPVISNDLRASNIILFFPFYYILYIFPLSISPAEPDFDQAVLYGPVSCPPPEADTLSGASARVLSARPDTRSTHPSRTPGRCMGMWGTLLAYRKPPLPSPCQSPGTSFYSFVGVIVPKICSEICDTGIFPSTVYI